MEKTKICNTCSEERKIADYYISNKRGSRRGKCKFCFRKQTQEIRDRERERFRAYWRKASKGYYSKNPKSLKLKRNYGITEAEYLKMYAEQRGLCKICSKKATTLCVDHCHITKKIRGLLCHRCNIGLGNFFDDPTILLNAVQYLKSI